VQVPGALVHTPWPQPGAHTAVAHVRPVQPGMHTHCSVVPPPDGDEPFVGTQAPLMHVLGLHSGSLQRCAIQPSSQVQLMGSGGSGGCGAPQAASGGTDTASLAAARAILLLGLARDELVQ
jgi:hypothetical protein